MCCLLGTLSAFWSKSFEKLIIKSPKIPKHGIFFELHSCDKCLANLLSTIVYRTMALLFFSENSRILEI